MGIFLYYLHILYIYKFTYIESGYLPKLFAYIIYIRAYLYWEWVFTYVICILLYIYEITYTGSGYLPILFAYIIYIPILGVGIYLDYLHMLYIYIRAYLYWEWVFTYIICIHYIYIQVYLYWEWVFVNCDPAGR